MSQQQEQPNLYPADMEMCHEGTTLYSVWKKYPVKLWICDVTVEWIDDVGKLDQLTFLSISNCILEQGIGGKMLLSKHYFPSNVHPKDLKKKEQRKIIANLIEEYYIPSPWNAQTDSESEMMIMVRSCDDRWTDYKTFNYCQKYK